MALPRTISGVAITFNSFFLGPFRASNGNHYALFRDSATSTQLEMWMADNGDNTWSEQDSANKPSVTNENIDGLWAILDGTDIHIVTTGNINASSNEHLRYQKFSTSSNTWTITNEVIQSGFNSNAGGGQSAALAVRSDGTVVCVYQGASDSIMGTPYSRIDYRIRSTGGVWGTVTAVDDAGSVEYEFPTCILGNSDKVHIVYQNLTNSHIVHKSLNSSNSLSSAEDVDDTAPNFSLLAVKLSKYTSSGGDEIVLVAWVKSSNSHVMTSRITNDGTPAAEVDTGDNVIFANDVLALVSDDATDTVYLAYADSTQDLFLDDNINNGGFGTDTEILDAATISAISANIYDIDNGDTVLGYIYNDGGTIKYNEYVVVDGGGTSHAVAGGFSADFDVSSAAQVDHAVVGTYTADFDVQSQLQVNHAVGGAFDTDFDAQSSIEIVLSIAGNFSADFDVLSNATIVHATSASFAADFEAQTNLQIDHVLMGLFEADYDIASALSIQHPISAVFDADIDVSSTLQTAYQVQGGFETDFGVDSSLRIDHAITGNYDADLDISSNVELQHALSGGFEADFEVQSNLSIVLSISGSFDADIDTVSGLLLEHQLGGEFSADLDVSSSIDIEGATGAISGAFLADIDAQSALEVFHSIEGSFVSDIDVLSALVVQYAVSGAFNGDFDVVSSIGIVLAVAGVFDGDFDVVSQLLIEHLLSGSFDADFDVSSSLVIQDLIKAVSGQFSADFDVQSAIEILWRVSANFEGDLDVLSALTVQMGTALTYYLGELGRYRLFEGNVDGNWLLYEGILTSYKLYVGSIEILDEVGNMIEKAIVGQTIAPKFTLTNGADNAQAFAEPDEVIMTVLWGDDDTEVDYALDDVDNPVLPDSGNEGVYYILAEASIIGTVKIYAKATWNTPAWSVVKNRRIEVVEMFDSD